MKLFLICLTTTVLLYTSCIPTASTSQTIIIDTDGSDSGGKLASMMSLNEIQAVCTRLANFRDQLKGIDDPRVSDEVLIANSVGGYGYGDLLYIVRRYGNEVGIDRVYEKCVKYLYLFNDGEYAGAIDEIIPDSAKYKGRSQEWLLNSG